MLQYTGRLLPEKHFTVNQQGIYTGKIIVYMLTGKPKQKCMAIPWEI